LPGYRSTKRASTKKRELNLLCRGFYPTDILGSLHQQSRRTLPRLPPLNMSGLFQDEVANIRKRQ
jgi:hypothetical protein